MVLIALLRYGVPTRMVFLNKLDRPGASFRSSLLSILQHRLHPRPTALTLPIASFDPKNYSTAEPGVEGIVDLVKWEVWRWHPDGTSTRHPLPTSIEELESTSILPPSHPLVAHLAPARTALLENLSMHSEELMSQLLELPAGPSAYLSVKPSVVLPHLRSAVSRMNILPVLCGSAMKHIGTNLVLDYVGELLADPVSVSGGNPQKNAPLRMLAWKVGWDKRRGWMTFVRVYSGKHSEAEYLQHTLNRQLGTLTKQSTILNATRNQREKVSKLLLLYASEAQEVDELPFGSVGVILGLKYTRTGDTLLGGQSKTDSESALANIIAPPPVMSTSVIPQSHSDLQPVQDALHSLSRTDPSVRLDTQEGQILVHGLGALHLEIVERRLRDEWGVNFEFGKRRVSYRESLNSNGAGTVEGKWTAEVHGKPVPVSITFDLQALEDGQDGDDVWDGNVVLDKNGRPLPSADAFSNQQMPLANIARGLATTLSNSPHSSLALSRVRVQVKDYQVPASASPSLLTGAAAVILRDRLRTAGMGPIMEPYIQVRITVSEDSLGKVVKDLTENGGEILDLAGTGVAGAEEESGAYPTDGLYVPPDWLSPSAQGSSQDARGASVRVRRSIHSVAPLSCMLDYSNRLRALSGGHGQFEMANAGFRQVSDARRMEILREIGRA